MRTSATHPLQIAGLPVGPGCIGITLQPGKKGPSVHGAGWDRDLSTDIEAIDEWGAEAILTLVEDHELELLGVPQFGEAVEASGMAWHHFPIPDLTAPNERMMVAWERLSPQLHQILDSGGRLLVHCRGGLGRAGTMAALLLIERGQPVQQVIELVRRKRPGAIETSAQVDFLRGQAQRDRLTSKIEASLFGGAIGDALGAEIEFWSLDRVIRRFPNGVDELLPHDGRKGAITDDTQMTLFTAEGLLRARVRGYLKGICDPTNIIHHALLRWLVTQNSRPDIEVDNKGLVADPRLHKQRSPGMTCLSALENAQQFGDPAKNDSKGCGTIMRVAPVGLSPLLSQEERWQLAMESSALTHGHRTGQESAAAWAMIIASVLAGEETEDAARSVLEKVTGETQAAIQAAISAPRNGRPETVTALGEGWVAEEALAIALYATLSSTSFDEGLRIAVTHGGDTDSTGAVAGNLLGLLYPDEVIAHPWRREVECADLIRRLAVDLAMTEWDDRLADRWPGW